MYKSRYRIQLPSEEQKKLETIVHRGKHKASVSTRARMLLKLHEGHKDTEIAKMLSVGMSSLWRLKKLYLSQGLAAALREKLKKKGRERKLDGRGEATLIQLACSPAPEGAVRWTLSLLKDRLVELGVVESIGKTTVHDTLKKTNFRRIGRNSG